MRGEEGMEEEWEGREEEGGKSEGERREYSSVFNQQPSKVYARLK